VQTVLPLDNGDSVKLTTARYYTPSGKSIQASGIVPEVLLTPEPQPGDADVPASLADFSEATLPGHLRGDAEGEEGYTAGDVLPGDGPIASALAELKQPGSAAKAQAALKAKAQAAQKAKAAKTAAEPRPAAARPAATDKPKPADKPSEPADKAKPAPPVEPAASAPAPAEPVK
jgi:carboxyl-terminal processing protease